MPNTKAKERKRLRLRKNAELKRNGRTPAQISRILRKKSKEMMYRIFLCRVTPT
jgi:hypothetical protein